MVTVDEKAVLGGQVLEEHLHRRLVGTEGQRFQRRGAFLEHAGVGDIRRVELVNDVDGLRGHPDSGHEPVEGDDLLGLLPGAADQVPELDAEQNFAVGGELAVELGGHRVEVGLLVERLPEFLAQRGVHGLRVIVPQEPEAGIDLFFEDLVVEFAEARQHADQQRQQVGAFRNVARTAQQPAEQPVQPAAHPVAPGHRAAEDFPHRSGGAVRTGNRRKRGNRRWCGSGSGRHGESVGLCPAYS